jgi:hypothetical protein
MKLKNYQEDIVLHVIDIILEDHPEIEADETLISDVAAYVLNRIPAKYIMSERGFTRLASQQLAEDDDENSLLDLVQLMMLVSKGMELVKSRRRYKHVNHEDDGLMATLQDVQSKNSIYRWS